MASLHEAVEEPGAYLRELSSAVLGEIEATLGQVKGNRSLQRMLLEPIRAQAGSRDDPKLRRSFLTLMVCQSLGGQVDHAVPAGAGIEFFAAALDVFDDVEDLDASEALWRKYGRAQALNAANALLMLAQLAVARLKLKKVDDSTVTRVMETIARHGTTACAGQHYDLAWESKPFIHEAQYFKMTRMKSASLVECACCVGAVLANVDEKTVSYFSLFGRNLGIAAQIVNDVSGVASVGVEPLRKSDIVRRKKTLPVIFALTHAGPQDRSWLSNVYSTNGPVAPTVERGVAELLRRSGAIYYSMVQAELYKHKAVQALKKAGLSDVTSRTLRLALGI